MNELQIFKYENNDVRTVEINGYRNCCFDTGSG